MNFQYVKERSPAAAKIMRISALDHQSKLFRVHKLVQEVVGESLTESERIKTFVECVRTLRFAFLQFFFIREF